MMQQTADSPIEEYEEIKLLVPTEENDETIGMASTEPDETDAQLVRLMEIQLSHPSIFDPDVEERTRSVWHAGWLFTVVILTSGLWLKALLLLPQALQRYSGGAFIVAFISVIIVVCAPLACLETFTGQYGGKPFFQVMGEVKPILRGVGFAIIVDNFLDMVLYGVHISHFLVLCIFSVKKAGSSSVQELYEGIIQGNQTLKTLSDLGGPSTSVATALFMLWLVVILLACISLRFQPFIAIITFAVPFLGHLFFMFYIMSHDGAVDGLHLFSMRASDLLSGQCWADAASVSFACMSVGYGTYPSLAAKNRPRRRSFWRVWFAAVFCIVTVIVFTLGFYGLVGAQARAENTTAAAQLGRDADLMRLLMPAALAREGLENLMGPRYLLTVAVLGTGGMVLHLACVIDSVSASCRCRRQKLVTALVLLLLGIGSSAIFTLRGSVFLLDLVEVSILGPKKLLLSLLFLIVVVFVYGRNHLLHYIQSRLRVRLLPTPFYWQMSWFVLCPLGLTALVVFAVFGQGGIFFRNDIQLWLRLGAVIYEFYYFAVIIAILIYTSVTWEEPKRPRGVWRLGRGPDDVEELEGEEWRHDVSRSAIPGDEAEGIPVDLGPPEGSDDAAPAPGGPTTPEVAARTRGRKRKPGAATPEAVVRTLYQEQESGTPTPEPVVRIRGLERDPGPDQLGLFVRLHSWSRGHHRSSTPRSASPSSGRYSSGAPLELADSDEQLRLAESPLPSVDSIETEYSKFLGRQSPVMRARVLPEPLPERVMSSRASWRGTESPSLTRLLTPSRRRVSPMPAAGTEGAGGSREQGAKGGGRTKVADEADDDRPPSLMDMLRDMDS